MNRRTLAQIFFSAELDLSLFDIRSHGVPIWERIRHSVYADLQEETDITGKPHTTIRRNASSYLKGGYLWAKNALCRNPFFADHHSFLFYGSPRRKLQDDGYWWDIHCDPVHNEAELDYLHVEQDYRLQHFQPARTETLRYLDFIEYTDFIKRKLNLVNVTLNKETTDHLDVATEAFQDQFGVNLQLTERVTDMLEERASKKPLYERFLATVEPQVVVVTSSYGKHTFIEVCKTRGIPVVELQHGVIYDTHLGYSYPGTRTKEMFPDYLLVWGDFWKEAIDYPIPDERIIPVGYPYLEQSVLQYDDVQSKKQILFISQGTIGEELSKFALEVHNNSDIDYDVVYKLHPGEYGRWRDEYPWLVDADFEIVDSSEQDLYRLFAESRVQVGVYSTAIYEGLAFGLETYLYDCSGLKALQQLVDDGVATVVATSEALATSIGKKSSRFDYDYYFVPNATENVSDTLEKVRTNS